MLFLKGYERKRPMPDKPSLFELLGCNEESPYLGYISYCIYKEEKLDHINNLKANGYEGEALALEIEKFQEAATTRSQQKAYRILAIEKLKEFSDELLADKTHEIEDTYKKQFAKTSSWWKSVFASVIGSFLFTLLTALIIFIIWAQQVDKAAILESVFGVEVVEKSASSTPDGPSLNIQE